MKKAKLSLLSLLTVLVLPGCRQTCQKCGEFTYSFSNEETVLKELRSPEGLDHSYDYREVNEPEYLEFAGKMKTFANRLSEAFANRYYKNNNIVVSPLSIELALGLTVRITDGETRQELLDAFDVDFETFNKYYKLFYNNISFEVVRENGPELSFTNSLWFDDDYDLVDATLDDLVNDYYCYSNEVDFNGNNKKSNQAIKKFILDKTHGIINPDFTCPENTIFALLNTLYLKDVWTDGINEQGLSFASEDYKFTNLDGSVSTQRLCKSFEFKGRQMITDDFSSFFTDSKSTRIFFIKPADGKRINEIYTKENLELILNSQSYVYKDDELMEKYFTRCIFPSIKVENQLDIKEMLYEDINIKSMFDVEKSDFSPITPYVAYCDQVNHGAAIEINNMGITGAAYTHENFCGLEGPDGYTEVHETFVVDKEFAFFVTRGNAVVFSGIVSNIDK